jgi:hypothetical protein
MNFRPKMVPEYVDANNIGKSGYGPKRTSPMFTLTSASGGKADILWKLGNVGF